MWRPIETAPTTGDFLVYLSNGHITAGRKIFGKHVGVDSSGDGKQADPTHWMPLPEPPERA